MEDQAMQALKALAQAATPGPWEWEGRKVDDEGYVYIPECSYIVGGISLAFQHEEYQKDCDYIAAANPAAIGSLIARVERQQARIAELEAEPLNDGSMPVGMAQAKRWVVQLRARIDSLLAVINAPAEQSSAPVPRVGGDTKLTDERIEALWADIPAHGSLQEIRHEFARAIEREVLAAKSARNIVLDRYSAGPLNDYGGGNVDWWWDYLRAELDRAHDFYQSQADSAFPAHQSEQGSGELRSAAVKPPLFDKDPTNIQY